MKGQKGGTKMGIVNFFAKVSNCSVSIKFCKTPPPPYLSSSDIMRLAVQQRKLPTVAPKYITFLQASYSMA